MSALWLCLRLCQFKISWDTLAFSQWEIMKKNNACKIRCFVDESFVPSTQQPSVWYRRLSYFTTINFYLEGSTQIWLVFLSTPLETFPGPAGPYLIPPLKHYPGWKILVKKGRGWNVVLPQKIFWRFASEMLLNQNG